MERVISQWISRFSQPNLEESEKLIFCTIQSLEDWYLSHKRDLPWRNDPQPYYVWLSEIMLQQTRVEAVREYYDRFLCALPTIEHLANAPEEQLLKLWEGLGYYNRVRNLKAAAQTIMTEYDGEFPDTYEEMLKLSGIGEYTAGAIASIAFGQAVSAVDGNVLRVVSRLLGSSYDIMLPYTKKAIKSWLDGILPMGHPGVFNQALMELGALVCVPNGAPKCRQCPWQQLCVAGLDGMTDVIPVKKKKGERRKEKKTVLLLLDNDRIAITKRSAKGLLAGMWQFPLLDGHWTKEQCRQMLEDLPLHGDFFCHLSAGPRAKHIFSHIEWDMKCIVVRGDRLSRIDELYQQSLLWISPAELQEQYSVPSAFRVYKQWLQEKC